MADKNIDPAHLETEATLKRMEAKIAKEYKQATEEMQDKIDDYWSRYKLKDQKWQEWVADGKKTADQYRKWQEQQLMVGKSWESLKDSLAQDMHNANVIAKQIAQGYQPEIFANNFNYAVYESEVGAKVNTSFTLYDKNTVNRLLEDDPDFIPPMGRKAKDNIAKGLDIPWNKKQVQSAMVQGILQGESIPQLSKRIATTVGEKNYKSAIRNARTMTTGVQNAGRMEGYKRSVEMGIDMEVEWNAVKDNRTRHEHRQLDGQRQQVGQPFEVHGIKIEYAGDPHAPAHMIYNCRCTLRGIVAGLEPRARKYRDDSMIDGMSYNEWKAQKKSKSNPITLPEEKGEAIARKYRREYAGGGSGKKSTNRIPQPVNETKQQQTNAFNIPKHSENFVPAKTSKEAEEYAKQFVSGGFNLTGKSISYKNMDVEVANRVNERLAVIYENFNIDKLSSIEAFGKGNKKVYEQNKDAPFFTSNFGNLGINSTIVKDSKTIEKYISDGNKDFEFVMNNMDKLSGKQLELAKTYQKAGRTLVGNSVEDMVTHEIGHHISYMQSVNKELAELQKTDWKQYASELSGYANHSFGEYVAESFNAYFNGEHGKLQPELISIFDKLRK